MNHVNLIGKMSSSPRFVELENGKKLARFTLSTQETYLDVEGKPKTRKQKHTLTAWGRWVQILEELSVVGSKIAVEGKLVNRFYHSNGQRKQIAEVEVNDLILMG